MCEEEAGILSAGAELQHGGEELRRSPGSQITHLVDSLVVGELVSIQQSCLQCCVGLEERWHLYQVQNSPDTLLAESSDHVVELRLLTDDAVGAEAGLCQGEPAGGPVASEGWYLDVPEVGQFVELDEVLLVLGHGEKSANCLSL